MYTVLAGGVGASRFLQGLVQAVDPASVTVISNTGDDVEMFGLHVSPDTDIVIYALAGAVNPETGWGLAGDTFVVVDQLQRFGYPRWFNLGDRDLAMAIHRTRLLGEGVPMHEVVDGLRRDWGLACTILPMSDEPVRTVVLGPNGELPFQDYMVKLRTDVEITGFRFDGIEAARPGPGVLEAIREAKAVILAPSNPFVSIGPILAVPGIRDALEATSATRVAISPIIAGQVVKGPAARMLEALGHEVSALGVARIYKGIVDLMVIDEEDRALAPAVEALGMRCLVTNTLMSDDARKAALARAIVEAGGRGVTPVIIPVNHLDRAKGRLADVLSPEERSGLALATLRTVVEAVRGAGHDAILLTPEPDRLSGELAGFGITVRPEVPGVHGLNAQLEAALAGRDEALVLHADLPLATAEAIMNLVASAPSAPSATLIRSPDGGTNAMLLRPPGRFPLAYGRGSCAKHRSAALSAGLLVAVVESAALALDLDTPADLAALLATAAGRAAPAGRLLLEAAVDRRLATAVQES